MQLSIIKPGLLATVQDLGRWQHLAQAVPVSGAMDTLSARVANMALGNAGEAAVIEFTYAGAMFKADTDLLIAYSGDGAELMLAGQTLPADRPLFIPAGSVVQLQAKTTGSRIYLAVAGGWDVPPVMGSASTYITAGFGGFKGRALKAGDILKAAAVNRPITQKITASLTGNKVRYPQWRIARKLLLPAVSNHIRVIPAPEFGWFSGVSIYHFLTAAFTLGTSSNRMGCQLEGPVMHRVKADELLSTAVTPGTIQVTGSGSLILLTADCQTTGGYPRLAQVAAVDLPLCGQLKPGDSIYFKEISRREAEMLYLEREQELHLLATAISYKYL